MSTLGIGPAAFEKSEISSNLNAGISGVFLTGMYTMVYFETMYLYFARNSSTRYVVPATITVLFLTVMIEVGTNWYLTKWQFIDNGDTRDTLYIALFGGPTWVVVTSVFTSYLSFVLADGLLIWRCYFVWNRSLRIILVPLLLVVIEAGILCNYVKTLKSVDITVSPAIATMVDDMSAASFFASFATTLVSTILIAYRISSALSQEGTSRRFKHIIDIVVQSGVVYSLAQLVFAISVVAPGASTVSSTQSVAFGFYIGCLAPPVAGISATILAARVAMLAPDTTYPSTSIHISGLQFHAQSTRQTGIRDESEAIHSMNIDGQFVEEGQEARGKDQ